jgi:hypothetical protein
MSTQFNFDTSPFSFSNSLEPSNPFLGEFDVLQESDFGTPSFGQDEFLAGLGLGTGAAFASQTGRLPTPAPTPKPSPFAQRVAANDLLRNTSRLGGATAFASRFFPAAGAFTAGYGIGTALDESFGGAISDKVAGFITDLMGLDINLPALNEDINLPALNEEELQLAFGGFGLPNTFRNTSAGAMPDEDAQDINPITLQSLGLESGPQEVLRTGEVPIPEEVIAEFSPASNLFSLESAAEVNPLLRSVDLESFAPTVEDSILPPQTLSQFIRYEDDPSQRTEQFVDAQGRLRRRLTPEALALQGFAPGSEVLAPEFADFEQASIDRQDRIGLRDFLPGETPVQRDTRLANARTQGSNNVPLDVIEAINTPANRRTREQIKRLSQWEASEQGKAMGGVAGLVRERTQFEPRIVEIDGQRLIQLSPNYYQPVRPEPKEGEKFEPRVIENNGFVYFEEEANKFKRQPSSDFEQVQDMINRAKQLGITMNSDGVGLYTEEQEKNIQRVMAQYSVSRIEAINEMRKQGYL